MNKYLGKSDGAYTESLMAILENIYGSSNKTIISFCTGHNAKEIREFLIQIWSINLSFSEGEVRKVAIKKFKEDEWEKAEKAGFSFKEKEYLKKMLDEINPSEFD